MSTAEIECSVCSFRTSTPADFRRHVGIVHCRGTFSTLKCGICNNKYLDLIHFNDHLSNTTCLPITVTTETLDENLQKCFDSLVEQMQRPVPPPTPASISSTPAVSSLGKVETDQTPARSVSSTPSMLSVGKFEVVMLSDDEVDEKPGLIGSPMETPPATPNNEPTPMAVIPEPDPKSVPVENPPAKRQSGKKTKGKRGAKSGSASVTSATSATSATSRTRASDSAAATPSATTVSTARLTRSAASPTKSQSSAPPKPPKSPAKKNSKKDTAFEKEPTAANDTSFGRRSKDKRVSYREYSDSDNNNGDGDDDSDYYEDAEPKLGDGGEKGKEKLFSGLNRFKCELCQLCIELKNDRPPMFTRSDKEKHAIIHLKFAPDFEEMPDDLIRTRSEFTKQMRLCFEEGFYDDLKMEEQTAPMES